MLNPFHSESSSGEWRVLRKVKLFSGEDWRIEMAAYRNDILPFLHSSLLLWICLDIKGRPVDMRREGKQGWARHSLTPFYYPHPSLLLRSSLRPSLLKGVNKSTRCGPCRSICLLLDPSLYLDLFFFFF